jgi:hypothetical protein
MSTVKTVNELLPFVNSALSHQFLYFVYNGDYLFKGLPTTSQTYIVESPSGKEKSKTWRCVENNNSS